MTYNIREIQQKDNKAVETVIRTCLIEFGANHEGTAWADPDLCRFSEIYNPVGNKYWIIEGTLRKNLDILLEIDDKIIFIDIDKIRHNMLKFLLKQYNINKKVAFHNLKDLFFNYS